MTDLPSRGLDDLARMRQAITEAAKVRRLVSPRPWVGAVVVPGDDPSHVGFVGATQGKNGPHAEVVALAAAGSAARGGTLFCTLEPCSHHGVTPPCAQAVIEAGISRVVVAIADPDRKVSGQGLKAMADAGIDVTVGVAADEVTEQLLPYLVHRRTGRPYVILKLAATIDGRTAAADGSSRWITGTEARLDVHRLRADSDAIVVGAGTVRADDPALTVRLPEGEVVGSDPLRVVLGRAPSGSAVLPALECQGDIGRVLDDLGERGVLQVLIEGGSTVAHEFHSSGLVDRYVIYLAPVIMGGDDGTPLLRGSGARSIDDVWRGQFVSLERLGNDLRIDLDGRKA